MVCDEKGQGQIAAISEKNHAAGGRGIPPFKKRRVGHPAPEKKLVVTSTRQNALQAPLLGKDARNWPPVEGAKVSMSPSSPEGSRGVSADNGVETYRVRCRFPR